MHLFIRNLISEKYDGALADSISILYGGSVKPNNAFEIFAKPDVDGGLIGGAALNSDDFIAIIRAILVHEMTGRQKTRSVTRTTELISNRADATKLLIWINKI